MSGNILSNLSPKEIGKRIRIAREKSDITQAAAAKIIDAARTTMVAIEKGSRQIKPKELLLLSRAFNLPVSDLLNEKIITNSFNVQFRAANNRSDEENKEIEPIIEDWQSLCHDYFDLEKLLNKPLPRNYPEEYMTGNIPIQLLAETIATKERNRLGLGDSPIQKLRDILEHEVGLRIFFIEMPTKFSEIYAYDEQLGGCLAINSNHPEERQRWSMSHGYLHFLAHRKKLVYHFDGQYKKYPESERLAELFAMFFLMPTSSISKYFMDSKSNGKFSISDLLRFADYYGVGVQTITHRLEGLKFLPTGTWDNLKSRGFKIRDAQKEIGLMRDLKERTDKYPKRYQYMAMEALELGEISEAKFAKLMSVKRLEARRIRDVLSKNL